MSWSISSSSYSKLHKWVLADSSSAILPTTESSLCKLIGNFEHTRESETLIIIFSKPLLNFFQSSLSILVLRYFWACSLPVDLDVCTWFHLSLLQGPINTTWNPNLRHATLVVAFNDRLCFSEEVEAEWSDFTSVRKENAVTFASRRSTY